MKQPKVKEKCKKSNSGKKKKKKKKQQTKRKKSKQARTLNVAKHADA